MKHTTRPAHRDHHHACTHTHTHTHNHAAAPPGQHTTTPPGQHTPVTPLAPGQHTPPRLAPSLHTGSQPHHPGSDPASKKQHLYHHPTRTTPLPVAPSQHTTTPPGNTTNQHTAQALEHAHVMCIQLGSWSPTCTSIRKSVKTRRKNGQKNPKKIPDPGVS